MTKRTESSVSKEVSIARGGKMITLSSCGAVPSALSSESNNALIKELFPVEYAPSNTIIAFLKISPFAGTGSNSSSEAVGMRSWKT